jgi:hypothetical protein
VSRCQKSGKLLNGFASLTWSSPTEVSEDQKPYFWLTSSGDSIRITNITSQTISQNLSFEILPNPCLSMSSLTVKTKDFSEKFDSPTSKLEFITAEIPVIILPYETIIVDLIPNTSPKCVVEGNDKRDFVSAIKNLEIRN